MNDLVERNSRQANIIEAYTESNLYEIVATLHLILGNKICIMRYRQQPISFNKTMFSLNSNSKYSVFKESTVSLSPDITSSFQDTLDNVTASIDQFVHDSTSKLNIICRNEEFETTMFWKLDNCQFLLLQQGIAYKTRLYDMYSSDFYSINDFQDDNLKHFIKEYIKRFYMDKNGNLEPTFL